MCGYRFCAAAMLLAACYATPVSAAAQAAAAQRTELRIVVIEGEDAVNVVQQKTAIAPVIEVRDRNDQPVAGAVVRFAIRSGHATFGGARNLTVVTNAAGRAAASSLVPTGNGVLQISASAAFQGQAAVATIVQTNVMTVAQAAAVSGAGASGSAAGGGAGGGGGLSATTIGIVGGAAAGGTLVATKALSKPTAYKGPFTIQTVLTIHSGQNGVIQRTCTNSATLTGTLSIELENDGDPGAGGKITADITQNFAAATCPAGGAFSFKEGGDVTGSSGNLQFNREESWTGQGLGGGGAGQGQRSFAFSGTAANGVINGAWSIGYLWTIVAPLVPGSLYDESFPPSSATVTLTRQ